MDSTITLLKSMTSNTIQALSFADYESATIYLETLYRETMRSIHEAQLLKYQHLGEFDLALEHAMQMIQVAPTSYSGYLYAGDCLVEQSKLHQAIALYDQGLKLQNEWNGDSCMNNNNKANITSNKNDDELLLLLSSRKRQISSQLHCRIPDWIYRLPFGVIRDDILPYLSMQDRRTCLNVSRAWRTLISGCTNLWRALEFKGCSNFKQHDDGVLVDQDEGGGDQKKKFYQRDEGDRNSNNDLLECLGSHVTRVKLSRMSAQELEIVFKKMIYRKCTSLKSLCLSECNMSTDQIAFYLNQLCQINSSLRYLEIIHHQQAIILEKLLDSCSSSLTHLYFKQNPITNTGSTKVLRSAASSSSPSQVGDINSQQFLDINDDLTLHKPINITHLYLDCTKPVEHMLKFCPSLNYLVLENRPQLELYQYVQLCPRLRYFQHNTGVLSAAPTGRYFSIWDKAMMVDHHNLGKNDNNNLWLLLPVSQLQQQQASSSSSLARIESHDNDSKTSLHGGQLQHLILGKSKISDQDRIYIKRIIEQNHDILETFTLHAQQGDRRNWAWVFGGALDPCRLVRLDLSIELDNSLVPLLRHSATTLQHVALRSMTCVNDNVLDSLGELYHLRSLILLDCINTTEQGTARLFERFSSSSRNQDSSRMKEVEKRNDMATTTSSETPYLLEHLEITGYSFCLTEHVLELVGKIPHLKELKLSWCGFGSANRMHGLVKAMVRCKSRVESISFTRSSIHADTLDILGDLLDLQSLKICMCTNVTDLGIRRIVDKKKIRKKKNGFYLEISECNFLSPQVTRYAYDVMGNRFRYIKG